MIYVPKSIVVFALVAVSGVALVMGAVGMASEAAHAVTMARGY